MTGTGGAHRLRPSSHGCAPGYPPGVADSEIPEHLIALQRAFDTAHAALVTASARPGPVAEWPAEAVAELRRAREEERQATLALYRARAGTEWEPWAGQQRVREAARGDG